LSDAVLSKLNNLCFWYCETVRRHNRIDFT
jgi:hypothetical protein